MLSTIQLHHMNFQLIAIQLQKHPLFKTSETLLQFTYRAFFFTRNFLKIDSNCSLVSCCSFRVQSSPSRWCFQLWWFLFEVKNRDRQKFKIIARWKNHCVLELFFFLEKKFSLKFSFRHATSASNYSLVSNTKIGVKICSWFKYG
jgi:hypothetical protein